MSEKKAKKVFLDGPISPEFVAKSIASHSTKKDIGAHSIFLGQVRNDIIDGKEVMAIEYTAYEEMADPKFFQIREAAFAAYPLTCLHIYITLGTVQAGEISLFVFRPSAHLAEVIKVCNYSLERFKHVVQELLEGVSGRLRFRVKIK